jgi:hypothetical protein
VKLMESAGQAHDPPRLLGRIAASVWVVATYSAASGGGLEEIHTW